jgi:hypothetical protein
VRVGVYMGFMGFYWKGGVWDAAKTMSVTIYE